MFSVYNGMFFANIVGSIFVFYSAHVSAMLKLGSSKTWEDALLELTGSSKMSSSSLVKYFEPLMTFLEEKNKENGDVIGWPESDWQPPIGNSLVCCVG